MGQGEGEVLGGELLDVGALDIIGLLELDDAEDLVLGVSGNAPNGMAARRGKHTLTDRKRARWRAAMSWYMDSTASHLDISRYSLYMLWVPERES